MPEQENPPQTSNMGEIRALVREVFAELAPTLGGKKESESEPAKETTSRQTGKSIQDEVKAELARLREAEERQQSDADLRAQVAELKAKADTASERAPVERRRVHKIMGWGD